MLKLIQHPRMLAAHRAVHDCGACALGNSPRSSDGHRAIDDGELRVETLDVASRLTYEVADLKGITNVKNRHVADFTGESSYIYAHRMMVSGSKLKERFSDFAEADNDYTALIRHEISS
jgi:hypothetical protein